MRRVVVTGLGLITPLGNDVASTWDGLVTGRSGIGTITHFDASAYEYPIAGEVKGFDASTFVDPKVLRRIDRSSAFALAAAQQAVADAGLDMTKEEPRRVGVVLGTGMGGAHLIVEQQRILDEKGPRRVSPFMVTHMLPDTATGLVAIALGARGPNIAITAACATGGAATGEAAEFIARGDCDVDHRRGLRGAAHADLLRRLPRDEGPRRARRPDEGRAPVRPQPQRLHPRRGRQRADPRVARARAGARGAHLRRVARRGHQQRRRRHGRCGRGRPRGRTGDGGRAATRRTRAGRHRLHQRSRHQHAAQRPRGDRRHPLRVP
jgi:hypothetical protein